MLASAGHGQRRMRTSGGENAEGAVPRCPLGAVHPLGLGPMEASQGRGAARRPPLYVSSAGGAWRWGRWGEWQCGSPRASLRCLRRTHGRGGQLAAATARCSALHRFDYLLRTSTMAHRTDARAMHRCDAHEKNGSD